MTANSENRAFRKEMLDRHRLAFDLYLKAAELLEEAITKQRGIDSSYAQALDLLFVQAFKSYQSLYLLAVNGLGEDAATISRRLFEIALQVKYLSSDKALRAERAQRFLANFWHNAKEIVASIKMPASRRDWWESQYRRYKKWLSFDKIGRALPFWFGSNFRDIASKLGVEVTYDEDYRLLSHIAHGSSRGLLLKTKGAKLQIHSDMLVEAVLVYGTKYILCVLLRWNESFGIIDETKLKTIEEKAINFVFKKN